MEPSALQKYDFPKKNKKPESRMTSEEIYSDK